MKIPLLCVSPLSVSANVTSKEGVLPFADVPGGKWFSPGVEFCYANSIVSGINSYTFSPDGNLTRAMFAVIMAKAVKADLSAYTTSSFSDIPAPDSPVRCWYSSAVEWAYQEGITGGIGNWCYGPGLTITRQQLAVLLMHYMEAQNYDVTPVDIREYSDYSQIAPWAKDAMAYVVGAGLILGTSTTTLSPLMSLTRVQAVTVITNFANKYFYADCNHEFTNATCVQSKMCSICGMNEGLPLGHSCATLTCKQGGTCARCNKYVSPDSAQHVFSDATCTKPKTCTVCGCMRRYPLGHTTSNGISHAAAEKSSTTIIVSLFTISRQTATTVAFTPICDSTLL